MSKKQQAAVSLMLNAIEAMSETSQGGRKLLIRMAKASGDGVLVAVEDTGRGLTPPSLDRLFGPFYTTKAGGPEVGLSICRSIIEAHGDRLWAAANEPRGAVFQFSVPTSANDI